MIELRSYQKSILKKAMTILSNSRFIYLAMEVRTGKTLTSLSIANEIGAKKVLFLTKKKAISSIENDYNLLSPNFFLVVSNYESIHKLDIDSVDFLILDEAHSMGAFPKPSKRAGQVKDLISNFGCRVCLLSGTPTPESFSQMYHQVYGIPGNPFSSYKSFYRFADDYVKVRQKKIGGRMINDYSNGLESIIDQMKPYTISYTQREAGFKSEIKENVLTVKMNRMTYYLTEKLKKDLVIEGAEEVILGDTPVKLMQKLHQLYSGTIKFESGNSRVIDNSKGEFVKEYFKGKKIGIFYKFKEELNMLIEVFGKENLTSDIDDFNENKEKNIALQIVSGREGISLKNADYLVFLNIDFSATSYWQARDRMTTKDSLKSEIFWIFALNGIESDIYDAVSKKKDYTVNHFKRSLLNQPT